MTDRPVFSRIIGLDEIPEAGTARTIEANPAERAALTAELGLLAVDSLVGEVDLTPRGRREIAVEGRVKAEIVQACVVSLVPVKQSIDEFFSLRFVRSGGSMPEATKPHAEIQIDPDAPEPPEVLSEDRIDLGAVLTEQFVLAIDPYPRAPGAELPPEASDPEGAAESPFAALANLKKAQNRKA
jgi:uncharacterized metal-binding protein YceD (DUF177 family)